MIDDPRTVSLISECLQRVAELPDRTSPDDWPEAMLVTADELSSILRELLAALGDPPGAWQPMETAPKDGTQFLVYWQGSPMGGGPGYDCIGWAEYQEIIGYGEPPALGWMPLPAPPVPRSTP